MSSSLSRILVVGTAVAVLAVAFFLFRRPTPEPVVAARPANPAPGEPTTPLAAPDSSAEVAGLKRRLAQEMHARQAAENEAAALRARPAMVETNPAAPLVRAADAGRQVGGFLPVMGELAALASRSPDSLSAEEKRRMLELQRQQARVLGALPEITAYQNNPEEYGRFFSALVQQAAGLTDAQAAQVETYMRERGLTMNQLRLNAAQEPTDPKLEEEWEERRDAFNAKTADGLRTLLPPGTAEKAGFGSELLEFLEMDFDKVAPPPAPGK